MNIYPYDSRILVLHLSLIGREWGKKIRWCFGYGAEVIYDVMFKPWGNKIKIWSIKLRIIIIIILQPGNSINRSTPSSPTYSSTKSPPSTNSTPTYITKHKPSPSPSPSTTTSPSSTSQPPNYPPNTPSLRISASIILKFSIKGTSPACKKKWEAFKTPKKGLLLSTSTLKSRNTW